MARREKAYAWTGRLYPEFERLNRELEAQWLTPEPALPQGQPQPRTDLDDRVDEYLKGMLGEETR